jgi:hypothetical protein
VGAGQPDYAQPVTELPVERALVVKFPEAEVAGKRYDDFVQISFTSALTEYVVGTNANAAKANNWPSGVLAKEIQFYATQNCWVRFNSPDAVPQFIPALLPLRFFRRTEKVYVYRDTVNGTLYCWIEG